MIKRVAYAGNLHKLLMPIAVQVFIQYTTASEYTGFDIQIVVQISVLIIITVNLQRVTKQTISRLIIKQIQNS